VEEEAGLQADGEGDEGDGLHGDLLALAVRCRTAPISDLTTPDGSFDPWWGISGEAFFCRGRDSSHLRIHNVKKP
jgi:hypothetical protein